MFIDEASLRVQGGRGGDGVITFVSSRHNPRGGPDGGNGGRGGNVVLRASRSLSTLYSFRNKPHVRAEDGENGARNTRQGARGGNRFVDVPVGTVVFDHSSGELLADLAMADDEAVVACGGLGGRGNHSFTTSVRQAPRICERGLQGEERTLKLELKLIADVGIIGYPNVGKSSLICRISAKRAKVADYPFTTLVPNLGVVDVDGRHQFVAVDIPGLIEGAHRGRGLGDRFLRHVERTRILIHMVDMACLEERDPLEDVQRINRELEAFEESLARRPQLLVGNKVDLVDETEVQGSVKRFADAGLELLPVSVATGRGVRELVVAAHRLLEAIPPQEAIRPIRRRVYRYDGGENGYRIDRQGDTFVVRGEAVERMARRLVLESRDARAYLSARLERMGVLGELVRHGVSSGDRIRIGDVELEYEG